MGTNEMYRIMGVLKFEHVYSYFLLKFIHVGLFENMSIRDRYYSPLMPQHDHHTRDNKLNLPVTRLNIEKNSTIFRSVKVFNEVPHDMRLQMSVCCLKMKYRKYLIDTYV